MQTTRIELDAALKTIFAVVCDNLPRGWDIEINCNRNEASIVLNDRYGVEATEVCLDDLTDGEKILALVNHAKWCGGDDEKLQFTKPPTKGA